MRFLALISIVSVVLTSANAAPSFLEKVERATPGNYIVKLKPGVSTKAWAQRLNLNTEVKIINSLAGALSTEALEYLRGFHAGEVDDIVEDIVIRAASAVTQMNAPWGLERISKPEKITRAIGGLDFTFTHDSTAGSGVDIYVLDTGVLVSHNEFGGRARFGASFVSSPGTSDKNGHGTHVAAIAAGRQFGVAKNASIISVKVLEDDGTGTVSNAIAGLSWVYDQILLTGRPSAVLMALQPVRSTELEQIVTSLNQQYVHVVAAAGDNDRNVYDESPSTLRATTVVGAMNANDERAPFSSYGPSVRFFAPGVDIISAWIGSNSATKKVSGTSQAAAHVVGIVAHVIGKGGNQYPLYQMETALLQLAQFNILSGIPNGTKNNLAQLGPQ